MDARTARRIRKDTTQFFSTIVDDLCLLVEKETNLDYPLQDGSTKRKHLLKVAEQTGRTPPELELPEVHPSLYYIKYLFDDMSMMRKYTSSTPQMLEQADIYYYCKLRDITLDRLQLRLIKKLDVAQVNSIVTCIKEQT